ncbi:hypothetical protein [Limosilactobacillus panis]|uniref:Uncharacterized protein n=1 Tax=Limosilactobacillus panis TaxID=47493 RepID=A0ABT7VMM5_9LACO|nr:hypothetical protein [Limosilactobacillus panis]MDM8333990.1 hypothetical protein [Limosilactobacillus panis]HJA21165.1 hypothetical protein [Candidatus Limosilactobacillus intestinipullorum]
MDEQKIKKVLALVNTGKPYDDVAPDVTAVRNWALDLCRQYNFEYYQTGRANLATLRIRHRLTGSRSCPTSTLNLAATFS